MLAAKLKSWLGSSISAEQLMLDYSETANPKLLNKLIELHGDDLNYFLYCQTDPSLAEDISQQTWLQVIEKRHLYRQQGQFKYWLFKLARNLLYDEFRRPHNSKQLCQLDDAQLPALARDEKSDGLKSEDSTQLSHLLKQLPFLQRDALSLQQEGFSLNEIAEICSTNTETVKTRLRYARDFLKQNWRN